MNRVSFALTEHALIMHSIQHNQQAFFDYNRLLNALSSKFPQTSRLSLGQANSATKRAAACSQLYRNLPSKSAVRAQVLCKPTAPEIRQTTQQTVPVKLQIILPLVSNSGILYSASPSFQLSAYKHEIFFYIHSQETLNTRLETI